MDTKCRLAIVLVLAGYVAYLVALFTPRLGDYVAKATLAALVGLLAYLYARYKAAQCRRPSVSGDEITRTPVA